MNPLRRSLLLCALMILAAVLAMGLKPQQRIADQRPAMDLARMIPRTFGDWREEPDLQTQIVDPRQQQMLEKIYGQTLNRAYVNPQGYRIMLALAYGSDQSDAMQVHRPEVCYPAQGFVLQGKRLDELRTPAGSLPMTRISTRLGLRAEPVSYWITIGDQSVRNNGLEKKLVEMRYGLTGRIPDGMLVRISSIDDDVARAYRLHDEFAGQLLAALPEEARQRLAGLGNASGQPPRRSRGGML